MKKRQICLILILFFSPLFNAKSQGTFDVMPETDGQQSQLFDVFADSNFIYVIGDLKDTTIQSPGQTVKPWWGVFDYNGSLLHKNNLLIKDSSDYVGVYGSRIVKNTNGNFVYVPIMYNDSGFAECLVLEIEPSTGIVIQFSILGNPVDSSTYIIPRWVTPDPYHKGGILLAAMAEINNNDVGIVFILDSLFNVTKTILIEDNGFDNYNYYLEAESDSTYILIGGSRRRIGSFTNPYFMRINSQGEILTFNLADGIPDRNVGFFLSENNSIRRDVNGNWIFSALSYFPGWHTIPYVFSYDAEFESMNWALNISADKNSNEQQHNLFGADYDENSRTYVVVGYDILENDNYFDSYIFKTNDAGDSLWTRHFIPLQWEPEEVGIAGLIDVKATPYHSYVSVGKAVGRPDALWRSWAILIDSFGCIVPGCENTVSNDEIRTGSNELFTIYPNPASSFVGLLCNREINEEIKISVFDLNGRAVKSVNISPNIGYQYILNVSDWIKGMYVLRIDSRDGILLQTSQIIIN